MASSAYGGAAAAYRNIGNAKIGAQSIEAAWRNKTAASRNRETLKRISKWRRKRQIIKLAAARETRT